MPPLPYVQVAEPEVAGRNENVNEDHSFSLRLLVAPGDLDYDLDAFVFFLSAMAQAAKLVMVRDCVSLSSLSSV